MDGIVAGCTDFSNVYNMSGGGKIAYIDSLEVLANKIVSEFKMKI